MLSQASSGAERVALEKSRGAVKDTTAVPSLSRSSTSLPSGTVVRKVSSIRAWAESAAALSLRLPKAITVPPLRQMPLSESMPPSPAWGLAVVSTVPPFTTR